jgi:adenine-specific DNA-methyltransferase
MSPTTASATPVPTLAQQDFTRLLRELFQLDQSDLDFGIYRIMRARVADIEAFITDELPKTLQAARQELAARGLDDVRAERDEARQKLLSDFTTDVMSPEDLAAKKTRFSGLPGFDNALQAYEKAQTQLDQVTLAEELERTIYTDLYRFFARYYDSGDFVTQPRAGDAAYMIPYNGEEVKLYWANYDQYYIKTGENFRHYRFDVGQPNNIEDLTRLTVEFELTDADTAAGNNLNKKGRLFLPVDADNYFDFDEVARILTLRFRFAVPTEEEASRWGTKQSVASGDRGVNERVIRDVAARIQATGDPYLIQFLEKKTHKRGEQQVNAFTYHLHRYTLPNQFDYFIHRNLGRFLGQELDYYLKHELLNLSFLSNEWSRLVQEQSLKQQLLRASVVRGVALRLIAFLHELEEYQRHLFEKKKLVIEAEYCISLDLVPLAVQPAVLSYLLADTESARKQHEAWQKLGMVPATEAGATGLRRWLTQAQETFDTGHLYARLPLYTLYLTQAKTESATTLRDSILGAFDDLDEQVTGVLINSENLQALNVLQRKYREQIKCIYIDPPYNTGSGDFPYKDAFQHSSWLSMLYDRLGIARELLKSNGVIFASISDKDADNRESHRLVSLLDDTMGAKNFVQNLIWSKNTTHNDSSTYSSNHEYILSYAKNLVTAQADKSMFRQPKPGFLEVIETVERINADFPSLEAIENEVKAVYKNHRDEYKAQLESQGLPYDEEAKRNDDWKGIYQYKHAEYRLPTGSYIEPAKAEEEGGEIWIYRESDPSWPNANTLTAEHRDPASLEYRFYKPLHPVTGRPCPAPSRGWLWSERHNPERKALSFEVLNNQHRIAFGDDENKIPQYKRFLYDVETDVSKSIIVDYTDGEKQLADLTGKRGTFPNPKPTTLVERLVVQTTRPGEWVVDFFGGSGTTADAVMRLNNRFAEAPRKFILVDMADYFTSNLLPRTLQSMYSIGWQGGNPGLPSKHGGIIQVLRLEQYEDTLNNMEFAPNRDEQAATFFPDSPEDRLRYVLARSEGSSKPMLGPAVLTQPFSYELDIVLANERRPVAVDLLSSFNLFLGLHVERIWSERGPNERLYRLVRGHHRGLRHLCIWRDAPGLGQSVAEQEVALTAEREWVQAQTWYHEAMAAHAVVYCNAQQLFGAESAETELHRLMFVNA